MKKISKLLFAIPFVLLLFACSKKTQKDNTTTKTNTTTNTITTENKKDLCTVKFDLNNGEGNIDDVVVEKGNIITMPNNPTREYYTFDGWYYEDSKWIFDSNTVSSDITLKAKWTLNKYSITLDNQAEGVTISGITSGNEYDYNSEITLTATNIPSGYTIKWSRSDGVVKSGNAYTFNVPSENIAIIITTTKPYAREDSKIYFGTYPQTKVTDNTLISELNTLAGNLPTSTNKYNWTDFNYYISSSVTSFMFYQDIDYDNDRTYDYRGVYFTQYRPYYYSNSSSTSDSYQDDNGYSTNTIYWFRYDPIEWDILTESDGKAQIIANLILDSQDYYPSNSTEKFEHNGGTGFANNYELSAIRKFLNDTFYNTAFNDFQKKIIETIEVDNSVDSTGQSSNFNVCNNTNDKIFLLSYKEVTTYYTDSTARQAKGSDYAKTQGLYVSTNSSTLENSYWTLRSPYYNFANEAYFVSISGYFGHDNVRSTGYGVRPACWITL